MQSKHLNIVLVYFQIVTLFENACGVASETSTWPKCKMQLSIFPQFFTYFYSFRNIYIKKGVACNSCIGFKTIWEAIQ